MMSLIRLGSFPTTRFMLSFHDDAFSTKPTVVHLVVDNFVMFTWIEPFGFLNTLRPGNPWRLHVDFLVARAGFWEYVPSSTLVATLRIFSVISWTAAIDVRYW